jgi:hypothetical protein
MGESPIISMAVDIVLAVQFMQVGVGHLSCCIGTNGFEYILNGDVLAAKIARRDGATVEHESGNIQSGQRHCSGGNGLVAAYDANDGVEHLPATNQFDGVGDQFAADQRGPHAFRAHGFAVTDGDGVELHRGAASGADAFFHLGGQAPQVKVAGHGFDPGVGHADDGFSQIAVGESDCLKHGTGRGLIASVGDAATNVFEIHERKIMTENG